MTTTTTKKGLLISYSIGYGYGKEMKSKKQPIQLGLLSLLKDTEEKYGIDINLLMNPKKRR